MWKHDPLSTFEVVSLLVSVVGLAAIAWQIRYSARQTQATVFADFTARYQIIDDRHPNASGFYRLSELDEEKKIQYFGFLESYLDLVHQEFELSRRGMIDAEIWNIWQQYASAHAKGPHFHEFWKSDKGRIAFAPNPRFIRFLEGLIH